MMGWVQEFLLRPCTQNAKGLINEKVFMDHGSGFNISFLLNQKSNYIIVKIISFK